MEGRTLPRTFNPTHRNTDFRPRPKLPYWESWPGYAGVLALGADLHHHTLPEQNEKQINYYFWPPQHLPLFALCRQSWAGVSFTE